MQYLAAIAIYLIPSSNDPGMAMLLGIPKILGQGGAHAVPSCYSYTLYHPGMAMLLGIPKILGQGGGLQYLDAIAKYIPYSILG